MKVAAEHGLGGASDQVIGEYLKYSDQAAHATNVPDAIVWPETAYPALFGKPQRPDEKRMEDQLRNFSANYHGTIIFGGYDQDSQFQDYNSLFFLPSTATISGNRVPTYHKNILLMFGETLPFADQFPTMKSWFPTMGFFGRGPGPEVYPVKNAKGDVFQVAPSICYEGLFPPHSVVGASLGADVLLNVTNDSWFGPYGEPYMHFALTRFRTIENRLPMMRSTNTGITAIIDPLGRIESKTELFVPQILSSVIHPHLIINTFFQKMSENFGGRWFEHLTQLITFGLLGYFWKRSRIRCPTPFK